jgi:hypothetical protein
LNLPPISHVSCIVAAAWNIGQNSKVLTDVGFDCGMRGVRVNEYRITKYNPAFRNSAGAYTRDEWTMFKDVGRSFGGAVLTREEYERVENAYVSAALAFMGEAGLASLAVDSLENHRGHERTFEEGIVLPLEQVGDVIRRVLREEFWCRLEGQGGFIHLGWDYYMYIGVPHSCPRARMRTIELGLYVEEFSSPYKDEN